MVEEVDKHILRKYDIAQKLGKGVRALPRAAAASARASARAAVRAARNEPGRSPR